MPGSVNSNIYSKMLGMLRAFDVYIARRLSAAYRGVLSFCIRIVEISAFIYAAPSAVTSCRHLDKHGGIVGREASGACAKVVCMSMLSAARHPAARNDARRFNKKCG